VLHDALRLLRSFHRLSQTELAGKLGISNSYLSEIESGKKSDAISVEMLKRYSEVFSVPVSSLMLFSEQLDVRKPGDKVRVAAAGKILKILDWIDERASVA